MKRAILVHGWDGSPDEDWFPWAQKEFQNRGWEVISPRMPDSESPRIESWLKELNKMAADYDEETLFIGHSIGCQAIMRFLENQNKKAKGAIFVAGWFNLVNLEDEEAEAIAKPWIETPINTIKVRENLGFSIILLGDNDLWVPLAETQSAFEQKLGSKVIVVPNAGHFTSDDGYTELPDLLKLI